MYPGQSAANTPAVAQEKVLQELMNQIGKSLSIISEAEQRLWQATHRIVNPRPSPVGTKPSGDIAGGQPSVETQLRAISDALVSKGQNLHEVASELERAI